MANCIYCGKPVGFWRNHHAACRRQHDAAAAKIPGFFVKCLQSSLSGEKFYKLTVDVAKASYIGDEELRQLAIKGLSLIDSAFANKALTKTEDDRIAEIRKAFDLGVGDLGEGGRKLTKAEILRDLEEGRVPNRDWLKGILPINLLEKFGSLARLKHGASAIVRALGKTSEQVRKANSRIIDQYATSLGELRSRTRAQMAIRHLPEVLYRGRGSVIIFALFFALIAGAIIMFGIFSALISGGAINKTGVTARVGKTKGYSTPSTAITLQEENLRTAITRKYSCLRIHEFRQVGLDKTGSLYIVDCGNAIYQVFVDPKGVMTADFACGDGWQCGINSGN